MIFSIGYSSEVYNIEAADISKLADFKGKKKIRTKNQITVLIDKDGDKLISGRQTVEDAIKAGKTHVPVRFIFNLQYPIWKLHITFIKKFRYSSIMPSSEIYHIIPQEIRDMGLERAFRNADNAFQIKEAWYGTATESDNLFEKLKNNLIENGYDDTYPMDIQLCRSFGVQDTLNQGHHRLSLLVEHQIPRASVRFSAAGYTPQPLNFILQFFAKRILKNKRNKMMK